MLQKIIKVGNHLVLPLPESAVTALALSEDSEVKVTVKADQKRILISLPEGSDDLDEIDAEYAEMVIEFIQENKAALEELAKSRK